MLSRSQQKIIRKLRSRKYRWQLKQFVAEGRKVVQDLLDSGLKPHFLVAAEHSSFSKHADVLVSPEELNEWSSLEKADEVLGVFPFPQVTAADGSFVLILDQLKDPGNLGTIIRTADWFGCHRIYCSSGTADAYNAKTVQSSMGSIARVQISYADPEKILQETKKYDLVCADMEGTLLPDLQWESSVGLVLGGESHGPSDFWKDHARKVTIPRKEKSQTESLNVAVAGAILMARLAGGV